VEARKTSPAVQPAAAAAACAVISVDSRPFLPVKALALPELTTKDARLATRQVPPAEIDRRRGTFRPCEDAGGHGPLVEDHQHQVRAVLVT
jgi:hypothetical protein